MGLKESMQEAWARPSGHDKSRRGDFPQMVWDTSREARERRVTRSLFGSSLDEGGDDGGGTTVDLVDKLRRIINLSKPDVVGREEALKFSVYSRAAIQTAEAAASLLVEAEPEATSRRASYKALQKRGYTGYHNRYSFWVGVLVNVQLDGVYYGEIAGTKPDNRFILSHPESCVLPAMDAGRLVFKVLGKKVRLPNGKDGREQRTLPYDGMLQIMRPNTKVHYKNFDNGPTYTETLKPTATYHALSHVIKTGLLIDLLERMFWESDGTLKLGHVLVSEQELEKDSDFLRELVASNKVLAPFKIEGSKIEIKPITAFPDYKDTLHEIKDDIEARIASFFGLNPSDLGSDAARTGTGAAELSESSWRHAIMPLVNSAKYEAEQKLLDGTALNVPSLRYFLSTGTAAKLAQSLAGVATRNEVRKNLFDLPPLSDADGGAEIYFGAQESMADGGESNNEQGENV